MKRDSSIDRVLMGMELPGEVPLGSPLIEIIGNRRVLIENQTGVCSYNRCSITIKVRQGTVCVTGEELELRNMTKNSLVITGTIFGISLTDWRQRR